MTIGTEVQAIRLMDVPLGACLRVGELGPDMHDLELFGFEDYGHDTHVRVVCNTWEGRAQSETFYASRWREVRVCEGYYRLLPEPVWV